MLHRAAPPDIRHLARIRWEIDLGRLPAGVVGIYKRGRYYSYTEAIPDRPTTRLLRDVARQHGVVIVAPMYEEEHPGRKCPPDRRENGSSEASSTETIVGSR
jgi:hypothetical protein